MANKYNSKKWKRNIIYILIIVSVLITCYIFYLLITKKDKVNNNQSVSRLLTLPYLNRQSYKLLPPDGKEGVLKYLPDRSSKGINVFGGGEDQAAAYFMDMEGNIFHEIIYKNPEIKKGSAFGIEIILPCGNNRFLLLCGNKALIMMDWDANVIWETKGNFHHDMDMDDQGNIYAVMTKKISSPAVRENILIEDDVFVVLSPSGKVKEKKSLMEKKQRILITGATGFIGRHLAKAMLAESINFSIFARSTSDIDWFETNRIPIYKGDLRDIETISEAVKDHDVVINLAGAADVSDLKVNREVNVEGVRNLISACRKTNLKRLIHFSTTCAGRALRDSYGETKLEAEDLFNDSGLDYTIFRPTMIYGPSSKEFDIFVNVIRFLPIVPIPGNGLNLLQPVLIDDLIETLLKIIDIPTTFKKRYDIAGPAPVTVNELIKQTASALGKRRRILHLPYQLFLTAARILGKCSRHVPLTVDQVMAFKQNTEVNIEPAGNDFDYCPTPLTLGLARVINNKELPIPLSSDDHLHLLLDEKYSFTRRPLFTHIPCFDYHTIPGPIRHKKLGKLFDSSVVPDFPEWPLDRSADRIRNLDLTKEVWPEGKKCAVCLTMMSTPEMVCRM